MPLARFPRILAFGIFFQAKLFQLSSFEQDSSSELRRAWWPRFSILLYSSPPSRRFLWLLSIFDRSYQLRFPTWSNASYNSPNHSRLWLIPSRSFGCPPSTGWSAAAFALAVAHTPDRLMEVYQCSTTDWLCNSSPFHCWNWKWSPPWRGAGASASHSLTSKPDFALWAFRSVVIHFPLSIVMISLCLLALHLKGLSQVEWRFRQANCAKRWYQRVSQLCSSCSLRKCLDRLQN